MSVNLKYGNIATVVGTTITFTDPIKFMGPGMIIQNMNSHVLTTIASVITTTKITVTSATGFSNGTTVQIQGNTFDGEFLSRYIPSFYRNSDLQEFLQVFALEFQRQWTKINLIPTVPDPDTCPSNLLPNLANSHGAPVNSDDEDIVKRTFIKVIQYGYKNKGSRKGIKAAFRSLGYNVDIKEYFFGKYIGTVASVTGSDIVTLTGGFELPITNRAFKVDDMIAKSTGAGSRVPLNNPGQWRFIRVVNSSLQYQTIGGNGAFFAPGDHLVVFAYNEAVRKAVNANFNDVTVNEFPLTSSFIKAFIQDRRPIPVKITDSLIEKLKYYLGIFKSSHARLKGSGIQTEFATTMSFRAEGDTTHRGPIMTVATPWSEAIRYSGTITDPSRLDDGHTLDAGFTLDPTTFLEMKVVFNYGEDNVEAAETITLAEDWGITTS